MTRRLLASAVLVAGLAAAAGAQRAERPRLNAGRVAGELVAGSYAGIGGFIVGRFVGEEGAELLGVRSEDTRRRLGYLGGVIGGGLATAGTVFAIGNVGDQTGDFDATYLGTGAGFVLALGLAKVLLGPDGRPPESSSTAARWATANVIALLPAIGATIAFNSTRRFK
jgi:hypothetical protein